ALAELAQALEKFRVYAVGGVQAEPVDIEIIDPLSYGAQQMVHHFRIAEIEFYQVVMPLPAFIPERIPHGASASKIQVMEPAAVMGILAVALNVCKGPELPAHMIKHTVQNNPDPVLMELLAQGTETMVVAQALIDLIVVL